MAQNSLIIGRHSWSVGINRIPKAVIEVILEGLYSKSLTYMGNTRWVNDTVVNEWCTFCHCGGRYMSLLVTVRSVTEHFVVIFYFSITC